MDRWKPRLFTSAANCCKLEGHVFLTIISRTNHPRTLCMPPASALPPSAPPLLSLTPRNPNTTLPPPPTLVTIFPRKSKPPIEAWRSTVFGVRWGLSSCQGRERSGAQDETRGQSATRHTAAEGGQRLRGAPVLLQSGGCHPFYGSPTHTGAHVSRLDVTYNAVAAATVT